MNHLDWEEQFLEDGWESLGQQNVCHYGDLLYFEISSYQNFEECIVMLKIQLHDDHEPDWDYMRSNEHKIQKTLAAYFSSEQWQENWSWSEEEPGLVVYDLSSTSSIQELVKNEENLARLLLSQS